MMFFIFSAMMFFISTLFGAEEIDVSQPLHIEELMPRRDQTTFIAIEPAIPRDYIALSEYGKMSYFSNIVYWGPEDVLRAYFKDKKSLSMPILQVFHSHALVQRKEGVLDMENIKKEFEGTVKDLSLDFGKWGDYPYCKISGSVDNKDVHMAYVGLNDEHNGSVFLFNLITPDDLEGKIAGIKFWDHFIQNTKQLPEPLFFRVMAGQELHPGYTIVDVLGRRIKIIAEKRKSDRKIQFIVIPKDKTVTFRYGNAFETPLLINWHFFEPVIKIQGAFVIEDGWVDYSMFATVFIKEVDAFTPTSKVKKNVFVKQFYVSDNIVLDNSIPQEESFNGYQGAFTWPLNDLPNRGLISLGMD